MLHDDYFQSIFNFFSASAKATFNVIPVRRKSAKHDVIRDGPIGMHSINNWPRDPQPYGPFMRACFPKLIFSCYYTVT